MLGPLQGDEPLGRHRLLVGGQAINLWALYYENRTKNLAPFVSRDVDILGDRPSGVPRMIYDRVRKYAAFYDIDRPLSAEVEIIENDLASDLTLGELISQAPIPALDDFFALGPIN